MGVHPQPYPQDHVFPDSTFLSTVMQSKQLKISHWRTIPHSQEIYKYSGRVIWATHPARWKGWAEFSSAVTCSLWHRHASLSFKPVFGNLQEAHGFSGYESLSTCECTTSLLLSWFLCPFSVALSVLLVNKLKLCLPHTYAVSPHTRKAWSSDNKAKREG